jgi:serine kinase of HPr protein (carbohydrate metabolism regulator)
MSVNIHASCVCIKNKGILFLGDSGSGKSDISLRLIADYKATLIGDDRIDIIAKGNNIIASAPKNLSGLLEVRGIGIIKVKTKRKNKIDLAVFLTQDKIERMPEPLYYELLDKKIPLININPFEPSATAKILAALSLL